MSTKLTRLALLALLTAPLASADTIKVSPDGAFATIQSGVDAASAGDTVVVEAGVYRENVLITAAKTGLTLEADGAVTIDALPDGGVPVGPGIQVLADQATIRGITVKNAGDEPGGLPGHGIAGSALDLRLEDVVVANCRRAGISLTVSDGANVDGGEIRACSDGIEAEGNGITVKGVAFARMNSDCIEITGDDARVVSCEMNHAGSSAAAITGARAVVKQCVISGTADESIFVAGDDARVDKNKVSACSDFAVEIEGDRARIRKNEVSRMFHGAFKLTGDDLEVSKNKVRDSETTSIDVEGDRAVIAANVVRGSNGDAIQVDGSEFDVRENEISNAIDGYGGIVIRSVSANGMIRDNEIKDLSGSGISLSDQSFQILVTDNVVETCGSFSNPAYLIEGTANVIQDNVAKRCGDDGYHVTGTQHKLIGNHAVGNEADGIDLTGSFYEVRDNVCVKNGGEGIENSADNVLIADNKAKKNRIDLANDNPVNVTFQGNDFVTGGVDTEPELD